MNSDMRAQYRSDRINIEVMRLTAVLNYGLNADVPLGEDLMSIYFGDFLRMEITDERLFQMKAVLEDPEWVALCENVLLDYDVDFYSGLKDLITQLEE